MSLRAGTFGSLKVSGMSDTGPPAFPATPRRVNASWLELQAEAPEDAEAYHRLQHPPAEYFGLFYADTSGQSPVAIRAALDFLGADHVMLGSDAPFGSPANHVATLEGMQLSPEDHALVVGETARRTLGL